MGGGSHKLLAVASAAVCMVVVSGCRGCDQSLLGIEGGTTVTGPDRVKPGASTEYEVAGSIGPLGKRCPSKVAVYYEELRGTAGDDPLQTKTASKGKSAEITNVKVERDEKTKRCKLVNPVKVPVSISPGRQDLHRVRLTATIYPPAPPTPLPSSASGMEGLAEIFSLLAQGEAEKIVTVEGKALTGGPAPNRNPVPAFVPAQEPAIPGQPLPLDARLSADHDGKIVRYDWDMKSDGVFEKSSASPSAHRVDSMATPGQSITLRVTDDRGGQGLIKVPVRSSSNAFTGGAPTVTPAVVAPNRSVAVGVKTTSPSAAGKAELFCADKLTGTALTNPVTGQKFASSCFGPIPVGFKKVGVRYTDSPGSSFPLEATTFYTAFEVRQGARATAGAAVARSAATAPPLAAQLKLNGATVRRLGKLKLGSTSGTVKGLIATGSGNGSLPKGTPRRYRSALRTLASGRFALKFTGAARLESTTINLKGSATMLVRSRRSRRTQMCLSVKAGRAGGASRFTVRSATGKARGFFARGTGPAFSFDGDSGRTAAVSLKPRKGKARKLSRSCRSLSRVLDGKLPKAKKQKSKKRKR